MDNFINPTNSSPIHAGTKYRRRRRYVDPEIQRRLLVTLVVLEAALVGASVWIMYVRLNQLIEESLYRIHLAKAGLMLPALLHAALPVLGGFVIANVAILLIVMCLWGRNVNAITDEFMHLIGKTRKLDFSPDSAPVKKHELLALTGRWRARERIRQTEIQEQVARLEREMSAGGDSRSLGNIVNRLNELLIERHSN